MAEHMRSELVTDALSMAVHHRRPEPASSTTPIRAQYVSLGSARAREMPGSRYSMGSKGDAYDNAVAESFFATVKKELIHRQSWPTRRELSTAVFKYIEGFYNRDRRHSALGMHSPADYEQLQYASGATGIELVARDSDSDAGGVEDAPGGDASRALPPRTSLRPAANTSREVTRRWRRESRPLGVRRRWSNRRARRARTLDGFGAPRGE